MTSSRFIPSPVGMLRATVTDTGISELKIMRGEKSKNSKHADSSPHLLLDQLEAELHEYFDGKRKEFDLPLDPSGTDFQKKVWNKLLEIPYGTTVSYSKLSEMMKNPMAVRAVAAANGQNPLMIIIPCHRVIGAKGALTGYAGGLAAKQFLLELESGRKMPKQMELDFG